MKRLTPIILSLLLLAAACSKQEGPGGTATIQGYVCKVIHHDDDFSLHADTVAAAKEDVFITYGSDLYFGDDAETSASGFYQFRYLNPGTYTVYAYHELPTGERIAERRSVTLRRGDCVTLDTLFLHSGKAYQTSMVKGWVAATYFDKNGNSVRQSWAYDQRVYLQRLADDGILDDTRVGIDGTFYFQKLQPGSYVVYTFGQNLDETPYPVSDTLVVDQPGSIFTTDTLHIRLKA